MKIETKYDIGQEVWVEQFNCVLPCKIKYIDESKEEVYYSSDKFYFYPTRYIYPTKEACEQAIKEMEG